ncbi:MAG: IS6 family transposase [Chloroflexota bacterium]
MTPAVSPCLACPHCRAAGVKRDGHSGAAGQRFRCRGCGRTFTERTGTPFAKYRWPLEIITTAVRWYCRFRLSAADVRDLLAERGVDVSDRTVLAWVHRFGPLRAAKVRRRARPLGGRWYVDETYVRVAGRWTYLYRAVDETGQVVDVLLREHRDLDSARAFFAQAIARRGVRPQEVITDHHASYRRAVRRHARRATHVQTGLHRARGETTKPVERSHVPVKDRLRPMRGLQSVATGQRLLEGIELTHAVYRGHILLAGSSAALAGAHDRARAAVATFERLAQRLRAAR